MFVEEFVFSFSLLAFAAGLLILGTFILLDAFRRFVREWSSESTSQKDSGVVLVIDIGRPIANGVRNGTNDLIQRSVAIPEKEIG
jgi:hypothetical protein